MIKYVVIRYSVSVQKNRIHSLLKEKLYGGLRRRRYLPIYVYLRGKPCKVFHGPLDVRLFTRKIRVMTRWSKLIL
jgi:hypothetical protein